MQKSYNIYNNLGYWFLLFILLIIAGFYKSYFAVIFQPHPTLIHLHFAAMIIWTAMLIVQPFLIRNKKLGWHRAIGKFSYFFFPAMILVNYLMFRYSYFRGLNDTLAESAKAAVPMTHDQVLQKAAFLSSIVAYYLFFLVLFYCLAIYNRKRSPIHARYMVATSLTLLGPTVDRIIYYWFGQETFPGHIGIESFAFLMADTILAFLLWRDFQNKKPVKTLATALGLYVAGQILYFTFQNSREFGHLVAMIMR
jgi:hypothetical protein